MDFTVIRPMLYGVLMWAVAIYAFRRGGWEERLAAAGTLLVSYLTVLVASPSENYFRQVESAVAAVDICLFLLISLIALRSRKFWPLWLGAIQGVSLIGHLAPLLPQIPPFASSSAVALWSYPLWIVLAFGVRQHDRTRLNTLPAQR